MGCRRCVAASCGAARPGCLLKTCELLPLLFLPAFSALCSACFVPLFYFCCALLLPSCAALLVPVVCYYTASPACLINKDL